MDKARLTLTSLDEAVVKDMHFQLLLPIEDRFEYPISNADGFSGLFKVIEVSDDSAVLIQVGA